MPDLPILNGASSVGVNSTDDHSVKMAQNGLMESMNKASVAQMHMMEKQAERQLAQTMINNNAEMMNSAKQATEKIRL